MPELGHATEISGALLTMCFLVLSWLAIRVLDGHAPAQPQMRPAVKALIALSLAGTALSVLSLAVSAAELQWLELLACGGFLALLAYLGRESLPTAPRWLRAIPRPWRWSLLAISAGTLTLLVTLAALGGDHQAVSAHYAARRFEVYGTCVTRHCGLNERAEPDDGTAAAGPRHVEGHVVWVLCQRLGATVVDPPDQRSKIWDLLRDGHWVSDLFVRTPRSALGRFSPHIQRCRS